MTSTDGTGSGGFIFLWFDVREHQKVNWQCLWFKTSQKAGLLKINNVNISL